MSVGPFRCRLVWRMGVHGRVAEVRDAVVDGCTWPCSWGQGCGCGWGTIAGMVVLMCWEMRTTICSGFVPRKRFMRDKI